MNTMYDNSFSKNKIQYDQLFLQFKIILQTNAMHGATDDGVKNLSDVYFIHIIAHKRCTRIYNFAKFYAYLVCNNGEIIVYS